MSIIVKITVPTESFVLNDALKADPELTIEFERTVPARKKAFPMFFAWNSEDFATFEANARADPTIDQLTTVDHFEDGILYRVDWTDAAPLSCQRAVVETDATLLQGVGLHPHWRFELRFPDSESASEFQQYAREIGLPFKLKQMYEITEMREEQYGLTARQRETLLNAFHNGYYEEPRDITLEGLAEHHDVSPGAIAGRLRRGMATLIRNTIAGRD